MELRKKPSEAGASYRRIGLHSALWGAGYAVVRRSNLTLRRKEHDMGYALAVVAVLSVTTVTPATTTTRTRRRASA